MLSRRLFLQNVPPALAVGTTVAAPAIAEAAAPLSANERIDAAVEEIKAAFMEKWPNSALYIRDFDHIDRGMLLFLTDVGGQTAPLVHEKVGRGHEAREARS